MKRVELEHMAGQMLICSPAQTMTDAELVNLIEDHHVGGVILFKRSCPDAAQTTALIEAMQRRARTHLLVMIDQEGGRVIRLDESPFRLPSARELATTSPREIENEVFLVAKRLREVGFNVNLAPVLDIDSNPKNPVIGDRSFGSDADTVWRCAKAYKDGLSQAGIIACGKHFPGHGDTDKDSHYHLPVVLHDKQRLLDIELDPFRRAVNEGFEILMLAHVLYKSFDDREPASLSKVIGKELLRDEMGFQGLVIADDLEMKAIAGRYPTEELLKKLLDAGVDLLPVCHTYSLAVELHRTIIRLVESGEVPMSRIRESYERIMSLKARHMMIEDPSL